MKEKLPYLSLYLKVSSGKKKKTLPDFEPVCEENISDFAFSEDRNRKKLLNLNPYKSPGSENLKVYQCRYLSYTPNHSNNKICRKTGRMLI